MQYRNREIRKRDKGIRGFFEVRAKEGIGRKKGNFTTSKMVRRILKAMAIAEALIELLRIAKMNHS